MSIKQFCWLLNDAKVGKNDKTWFPRWLRRYASTVPAVDGRLPVTVAETVQFLRSLRDSGTPVWQRLQAVRAVEAYRNLVLSLWDGFPIRPSGNKWHVGTLRLNNTDGEIHQQPTYPALPR